jgi:DNA-binding transcriptional MerR regulator
MGNSIRIGELAKRFGLNPKTIRYYEAIGLLPQAGRSESGYRIYDEQDVERLSFIRRAKTLGLTLDEIRDILAGQQRGELPCSQVLDLIDRKIRVIDQRVADLVAFRAELSRLRTIWSDKETDVQQVTASACICPIIEQQTMVEDHRRAAQEFEPTMPH